VEQYLWIASGRYDHVPDLPIPLVWQSVLGAVLVVAALAGCLLKFSANRLWIVLAAAALAADQVTKRVIEHADLPREGVPLLGGAVRLFYLENRGLGFGSGFADILLAVACLALLTLVLYSRLSRLGYRMSPAAEAAGGLLVGGLLGIAVDRAFLGYVVDFILVGNSAYVYNVADLAGVAAGIVMGARLVQWAFTHARADVTAPVSVGSGPQPG